MPHSTPIPGDDCNAESLDRARLTTAVSGREPAPHLRGIPLSELVRQPRFMDLFHLLTEGELPTPEQSSDLQSRWLELPPLDPTIREQVLGLPWNVTPVEALRAAVVTLAQDVERQDELPQDQCLRLLTELSELVAARYCATQGVPLTPSPEGECQAGRLLTQLCGQPPESIDRDAFGAIFLLLADPPGSPSTLAVRAAAAGGVPFPMAMLTGLAAFEFASWSDEAQSIFDGLDEVESLDGFESLWERIREDEQLPVGFRRDVLSRSEVELLTVQCRLLADDRGQTGFEELAELFAQRVAGELGGEPTLLWPLTRLFHYLGLDFELVAPLACLARMPGWCAHYLEQSERPLTIEFRYLPATGSPGSVPGDCDRD